MSRKDYIEGIQGAERRYFENPVQLREVVRKEGEKEIRMQVIEGIAAVVESRTDLYWFREEIARGAFDDALAAEDLDVRALFNHDPNMILARRNKNTDTLELYLTDEGHLGYRFTTPNRSYALDLQDAIQAGDVSQSSFAFQIEEASWIAPENGSDLETRRILKIRKLFDVSPVTYPAYQDTAVGQRSLQAVIEERKNQKPNPPAFDEFDAAYKFNQNNS